jgi:hypothetical protein
MSRTLSSPRWTEYGELLEAAEECGYEVVSFEDWLLAPSETTNERVMLLRHDVDQHPRSALKMSDIELRHGVTSTWYFRWRTANAGIIRELRRRGCSIGLHYETLTRTILQSGPPASEQFEEVCDMLRDEIACFSRLFGPLRTVAPHGDTRVPNVSNASLMLDRDPRWFKIAADANVSLRGRPIGLWMTDRSRADGSWERKLDPHTVLVLGITPVLCLTHPNNWVSGPALWIDRLLGHLPGALHRSPRWACTGQDAPQFNAAALESRSG